ncbi:MAG: molybdopterin cofactor-binding domain-containing protein [Candidatus Lustribacter sp.]
MSTVAPRTAPAVLTVNGISRHVAALDAARPLLWYLRDRLGLKGTKFGCGHGGCGACTVQIDGAAVPSCTVTLAETAGKDVRTIEGLAACPNRAVFRAWMAEQVPQCGYCQPGVVVTAEALLERVTDPSDAEIDAAFEHVLCRCGSYQRIRDAVHRAARLDWTNPPFPAVPLPPPPLQWTGERFRFNPWVSIAADGTTIVTIERSEMGQGVNTALAMLVAEELDVSLERVRTEFAPADHVYDNPVIHAQITVGSMSMCNAWLRVRRAGADARARLIAVAAAQWGTAPENCRTADGAVTDAAGMRRVEYGLLAAAAAALPAVANPPLKDPAAYRLLGHATARLEIPEHIAGRSCFGLDVTLPNMRAATVILPPRIGAKVLTIDARAALELAGVRDVFAIGDGVAIVADDLWSAFRGRSGVEATWTTGDDTLSTNGTRAELQAALERPGAVQSEIGDAVRVLDAATNPVGADYATPYVAHAPIEPINCTVRLENGHCDVWIPTQGQSMAQAAAAEAAGLPPGAVRIHTTYLGGGFGRRSVPDVVTQAVQIAQHEGVPVQLAWTRADDLQHDRYRPSSAIHLRAALDGAGQPTALLMRIAGPKLAFDGVDIPYAIPNLRVECVDEDPGVPTGFWRSVGASQNAFAIECFIDELAAAAQADPVAYRLANLPPTARHRAVLELAAAQAGWGRAPAERFQGVALYAAHGGWAAQVAEISIHDGRIAVHRVVCAVDCGFAVNPDTVRAQIEGAIGFGLTAALKAEITLEHGHVVQTGFHDFPLLTMAEMPRVEVHVLASTEAPSGAGECGVPPIAPAVANAVFAATGRRLRSLPLRLGNGAAANLHQPIGNVH